MQGRYFCCFPFSWVNPQAEWQFICVSGPSINCIHCLTKLSGMSSGPAVGIFFRFLAKLTTSSSVTGEIKMDFNPYPANLEKMVS